MFLPRRQQLEGDRFHDNEKVEIVVRECLRMQEVHFYRDGHVNSCERGYECARGLFLKNNDIQWNKWVTFNFVMTCRLVFMMWRTLLIKHVMHSVIL
jgi:hypothetical protein